MIVAGCDVGSLTAEAVLLEDGAILGSEIMLVRPTAEQSARDVMDRLLADCTSPMTTSPLRWPPGTGARPSPSRMRI